MQTAQFNDSTQVTFQVINKSNMSTQPITTTPTVDVGEVKLSYFGQSSVLFTYHILNRVIETVNSADSKFDYYRVMFPNYHQVFSVKHGSGDDALVKKYHVHKLIYGPTKTIKGKEEFQTRTDEEDFWGKQWGFEYSPFRMAQKVLKDYGLYLVDHTFGGETPFFYLYKYLPARDVIDKKPWHDYCNVPALCSKDFASKKLSHEDACSAASLAWDKFSSMCKKEGITTENLSFLFEDDTTPQVHKKKFVGKVKHSSTTATPPNTTDSAHEAEDGVEVHPTKKTFAQVVANA